MTQETALPPRPETQQPQFDSIPAELKKINRWVLWQYEVPAGGTKWTKVPYQARYPTKRAITTQHETWGTFQRAQNSFLSHAPPHDGVGIVLTQDDRLMGVDLDDAIGDTGEPYDWAREILDQLQSYTEISPSGAGYRVFLFASSIPPTSKCRVGKVEIYQTARYLTVTGDRVTEYPAQILDRDDEVFALHQRLFPQETAAETAPAPQRALAPLTQDDDRVMQIALRSTHGAKFGSLYGGDTAAHGGDDSQADMALVNYLAFYCGAGAHDQVDRMFRLSGLMRDKWDKRRGSKTYGEITIAKAYEGRTDYYTPSSGGEKARTSAAEFDAVAVAHTARSEESDNPLWMQTDDSGDVGPYKGHLTDSANADRYASLHKDKLRYEHTSGVWMVWDGTRWAPDRLGVAQERARDVARSWMREASTLSADNDRRAALAKHALACEGARTIQSMMKLAATREPLAVDVSDLDKKDGMFNCRNGTLELATGLVWKHRQEHLLTKVSPVDYDPNAKAPAWLAFLDRVVPDPETQLFLQRAVGYTLTPSTREQCFFFLYGEGRNGKSTFREMVEHILGDYGRSTRADTIMAQQKPTGGGATPEIAALIGLRLCALSEIGEGQRLNESLIKDLTGGDNLYARHLYGKPFTFRPTFKLWMFGNHKPVIRGQDEGIWRRVRYVPFEEKLLDEEVDLDFKVRLYREAAGILAWAVEGYRMWQEQGLGTCAQVQEATSEFRSDSDTLGQFLADCCTVSPTATVTSADLYYAYKQWAERGGEYVMSAKALGTKLAERGFKADRTGGVSRRRGLYITPDGGSSSSGDDSSWSGRRDLGL